MKNQTPFSLRFFSILSLILLLTFTMMGCASKDAKEEDESLSAKELYEQASKSLNSGDYETAIKDYEDLEARYPFGQYAEQAQLDVAYAYYKYGETESAVAAADRFIRTHPRHPNVDYAYYLKGLSNFLRGISFLDRYLSLDLSKRDAKAMEEAFFNFKELVTRFPESEYAEDSRKRMVYLRSQLAFHEVDTARYYLKITAYIAATNRAQYVLEHYQGTPAAPEALLVMIDAYGKLKLPQLQQDAQRVLDKNYPGYQRQLVD